MAVLATAAWALTGTPFEALDGDLIAGGGTDWGTFHAGGDLVVGVDLPPGQDDDSFSDKEDAPEPEIIVGSIPKNKSDLLRFYTAFESIDVAGEKKDFLYLAWIRANTLGSANMDFEFNQSSVLSSNGTTPLRTPGDLLVTFGFTGNDGIVELGLSEWSDTGPCEAAPSGPCWGPIMPLGGFAEGSVNETTVLDPVENVNLAAQTFGEAAINLTDAGVFDRDECVTFGGAYVKSRSSTSFTSSLKDFIEPIAVSVSNCSTIVIRKDAVPDDEQDFTFQPSPELAPDPFFLDDDGDDGNGLSSSILFESRVDTSFTITEDAVEGWDLTDINCTTSGGPGVDVDPAGVLTLDVTAGENVDCTFVNTKRGKIVVNQVTTPGGELQVFDYSLSGGLDSIDEAFGLADADPPYDSGFVKPGVYAVGQTDPGVEWDLTSATCDDGSPAGAVDVAPGETVTCTFVNVKRGRITVDVVTDPAADPALFGFSLTGGPDSVDQSFGLADADSPHDSNWQRSATYAVVADDPGTDWDLSASSCDDGSDPGAVALDPGEIVGCTFTYVRRGRILVDQVTDPSDDPQSFEFSLAGGPTDLNQSFGLTDAADPHDSDVQQPGTFAVSQTDPGAEWDLVNAVCSDGSPVEAVVLDPGETVTCTFTNVKRGHVIIDTVTDPSGDPQSFDYDFNGGPDSVLDAFGQTDTDTPRDSGPVKNGTYVASQADPGDEWDLVSAVCSDGSPVSAVAVAPGETVTCTFTNVKRGHILVQKVTDPAGSADAFNFTLGGGPDGVDGGFSLLDGAQAHDSGALKPGTYAVAETDAGSEWDLTSTVCSDGSPVGAVDLGPGETVTCTFTNTRRAHIVIDQVTDPSGDPQVFQFDLTGGSDGIADAFGLRDADTPHDSNAVKAGTYSVTQTDPGAEWDLKSAVCDNGSPVGAVVVAPGETVTCTFVNVKRGHILVDKVTVPASSPLYFEFDLSGGPESVDQSFSLRDQAAPRDSGPVRPGTYSISESDIGDMWDLTGATCDDGSPIGAVVVDPGETVTCTFTNTKRARILIDEVTDPSGDPQVFQFDLTGGPADLAEAFGLRDADKAYNSEGVVPGTYAVAQTDPGAEWDLISAVCDNGSPVGAVVVGPGETTTCTFTNVKRAHIIVDTVTDPSGDTQSFDYDMSGGPDSLLDLFSQADTDTPHDSGALVNGTYAVSQDDPGVEWDLVSAVCSDGSPVSAVALEPGETVTCTFTNVKRGHILVQKVTSPGGETDSFSFTLDGGPDGVDSAFPLTDGAPAHDSGALKPGTYAVAENDAGDEWDLTASVCSDGSPPGAVDLAPGETVTCIFTNTKRAHILIDQVTDPSGDPYVFQFDLTGGVDSVSDSFGLRDADTPHDSSAVKAGTYSVVQNDPGAEWDLDSATCDNGSPVGAVVVAPGETVTCTFVNVKRGHIVIDKVTVPGSSPVFFDFSLTGGADAVDMAFTMRDQTKVKDSGPLRAGTYAVAEGPTEAMWELTSAVCDDGSPVGAVELSPGETVTCTFTNTKRAILNIVQDSVPNDPDDFGFTLSGGADYFDTFTLDDDGDPTLHRKHTVVLPDGGYSVVQGDPGPAWDLVSIECSDARADSTSSVDVSSRTANVSLVPGANVTCIFTTHKRGRISIEKYVVNEATGEGFDPRNHPFEFNPSFGANFFLKHGETEVSVWLPTGQSYSISEIVPQGFDATSECEYPDGSTDSGGGSISVDLEPAAEVHCIFTNEMTMHPGSKGFWRNWRNHYSEAELLKILAEAMTLSPIYSSMVDGSGELVPGAFDVFLSIMSSGGNTGEHGLLQEQTTTIMNLAVSKSEDPEIRALQRNDDLCWNCIVDISGNPTAQALMAAYAPCTASGEVTVSDLFTVLEQAWVGNVYSGNWDYGFLSGSEMGAIESVLETVNGGRSLIVDPSGYPERVSCVETETPHVTTFLYRDDDLDGWGAIDSLAAVCAAGPTEGWTDLEGDCDDTIATVNPEMPELCDGLDNDCDGIAESGSDTDGDTIDDMCDAYPGDPERSGPIFLGSVDVDDVWTPVNLPGQYLDPIVIVGPPTYNDADPGVIRLRKIESKSFEIRFQEWQYLDTIHDAKESVSFLILERGRYTLDDGSIWEADSYTVSGTGATKGRLFTQNFPDTPALILTIQHQAGGTPVTARARSVQRHKFEAALYEEEALMDGHTQEDVGYLAVYSNRRSGAIKVDGQLVPYALQTHGINDEMSPVLAWNLMLQEEQSFDPETDHADETVSMLALGSHLFATDVRSKGANTVTLRRLDPDAAAGMEWGMLSGVSRTWMTVPLHKSYTDPVVIVKPLSSDGSPPSVVRLRSVDSDSFDVRLREWNYLKGTDSSGWSEQAFYMVVEAGQHEIAGLTVEAGITVTNATLAAGMWKPVALTAPFGVTPAVFTAIQSRIGSDPVVTRVTGADATGFDVTMEEEEGVDGLHPLEVIGWVAIEPGSGLTASGRAVEVFTDLVDSGVTALGFLQSYSRRFPSIVADISSTHDMDTCTLRHDGVSASGVSLFIEEEQSMDAETDHSMEDVSVFVAE